MAAFGGENKCVIEKVFGLSFDPVIKMATLHQDPCKQNKRKTSQKTCAAAMCNNRSENRPDLTYHKFPSDPETSRNGKFSCEEEIRSSKALRTSIVVQNISYQTIIELVSPDIERT